MPTVTETLQAVRAAATANSAALASVKAEGLARLVEVNAFPNSPSKGVVRDQLTRLLANYETARVSAQRLIAGTTSALNAAGTVTPDPVPSPTNWSTAAF